MSNLDHHVLADKGHVIADVGVQRYLGTHVREFVPGWFSHQPSVDPSLTEEWHAEIDSRGVDTPYVQQGPEIFFPSPYVADGTVVVGHGIDPIEVSTIEHGYVDPWHPPEVFSMEGGGHGSTNGSSKFGKPGGQAVGQIWGDEVGRVVHFDAVHVAVFHCLSDGFPVESRCLVFDVV